MPFVVSCAACGKRLNIPEKLYEEKIRGHVVTIACKGCGADIKVDGTRPREEVDLSADGAKPAPAAGAVAPVEPAPLARPTPAADAAPARPAAGAVAAADPVPAARPAPAADAAPARPAVVVAPRTGATMLGAAPVLPGQAAPAASPAALPGLGGLPKPGAVRAGAAPRPATGSSPQAAASPAPRDAAPEPATPHAAPGRGAAPQGMDFAKMTFPGTPAAMGRAGGTPSAASRGFQPVAARPGDLDQPSDPSPQASSPSTTAAEPPARRRGVPLGLRRTAPESPAARVTPPTPAAGTAPTAPPARHEDAGAVTGATDPAAPGAVSEWLWAVSFAEDDDRELTFAEVKAAILDRKVSEDTIAWREGLSDWLPLGEIDVFRPVFAELARSPARPRTGPRPALPARGGEAASSGTKPETPAAPAAAVGGSAAAGGAPRPAVPTPTPGEKAAAPIADEDREDWRRSTADLLAEIAGGTQLPQSGAPVGAAPVVPDPDSLPPFPRPPAAPRFSLSTSLAPPKSASRTIAYVVVAALVLAALVGIVLLIVKGLAPSDDPTLRPGAPPTPRVSTSAASSGAPLATIESTGSDESGAPAPSGSAGTDLARMVRENVDRSAGTAGTPFDERLARAVLAEAAQRAALCRKPGDEKGPAKAAVTFDPATGRPAEVRLIGRYQGTGSGACIEATLRAVRTRKFSGNPVTLEQTVMLR